MGPSRACLFALPLAAMAAGCGSKGGGDYAIEVGSDDGGGSLSLSGADAGLSALDAHIEQNHITVTLVTVSCSGPCAQVMAVATGGHAPYSFRWDDGSTSASRTVYPTASTHYDVKVSDTATSGELGRPAQTVDVPLGAHVVACPDGGAADGGGLDASADACARTTSTLTGLPETLALDVTGPVRYFAGGASLPAGKYRVEYADGCVTYGPNLSYSTWGWTIHAGMVPGNFWLAGTYGGHCVLVGSTTNDVVGVLPGTTNPPPGIDTYANCVAANKSMDQPLDFDFQGGPLGLFIEDTMPADNTGGPAPDGVTPTWKLTALSVCAP